MVCDRTRLFGTLILLLFCRSAQTIGAEFSVKQIAIPETNYIVELFLYDCAGQSIFNQLDMSTKYVSPVVLL